MCDLDAFLGFYCLMKSLVVTPAVHDTSGKLVNDQHLSVLDDIIDITLHYAVRADRLLYVVGYGYIVRIVEVVDPEELLRLGNAAGSQRAGLCLFVNDVIAVDVLLLIGLFIVAFPYAEAF